MSPLPDPQPKPPARWPFDVLAVSLALVFLVILGVGLWWLYGIAGDVRAHVRPAGDFVKVACGLAAALIAILVVALAFSQRRTLRLQAAAAERERILRQLGEAEAKYRSIFDNAVEGIFQTTPDGRFLTANKAMARMHGYATPEEMMAALTDVATQLYVDPTQHEALLAALQQHDAVSNFEFEITRTDGRTLWVRENVHAVRDEKGALLYLEGTVEDVSVLWWGEQRRRLQYAMARVIADAASVEEARPALLRTICETLEWDMGAVWDVDAEAGVLQCVEVWSQPEIAIGEFEKANAAMACRRGQRLAGEVWQLAEPKWIADLATAEGYLNAPLARACGMASAFGVPIEVGSEVCMVLEFFSPRIAPPDEELLQTLGAIASQLSYLIERKRSEEALRRSEMRKAAILRSALDGIITFDLDGKITEFNPAAERAFGCTQEDAVGRELAELIIPAPLRESHRRGLALYNASADSPAQGRRMEIAAMRGDGSEFPAELAISRFVIDDKPMFTAYLRDITQHKAAERLNAELAAVVANSNDAMIACTLEGVVTRWNLGAERIYGYAAEEITGRPLSTLIPPERLDEFPQTLNMVKAGQSLASYESVRLRKDGKKISVSLTDSPIRGDGGRITGLSSIARDITERKRLEEELLQAQKMDAVGRLAGGIAHDFNNILTAILGYSDLIIGQTDERQWMYKHLTEIRKAADFAASLTHQLLAFSRRQPLFLRVFNLNDSVRSMQKMLGRVIGENIVIHTHFKAEIGRLKADSGQLEQVLLNLCVNARDAMPKGGSITIQTEDVSYLPGDDSAVNEMPAGEYVKLTVTDTGHGMTPEVRRHIFEPFFTTKEQEHGTGLGLATCYGIVKQSGGYITVESVVGEGTSFAIYLPRVDESGEKSAARLEVGQLTGGTETVLYVEDEITVRSLTTHVLLRLGYTVLEAADCKSARDAAETNGRRAIHLLFSDVVLPDSGGQDLAEWMRGRSPETKILFTSGYVDEKILQRHGLDARAAFLQKPFTPADLAKKVREVLDGTAA